MLVPAFCENHDGILPDEFYDSLPQYCSEEDCGFPMEMSETLTQLHCSNPRCPSKIVQRLIAIANTLGVKDLGEAKATKFVHKFKITNPLDIFSYNPKEHGSMGDGISVEVSEKIVNQFKEKNSFTLTEYVRIANLPYIQTSAVAIFDGYDDIVQAYKDIETVNIIKTNTAEMINLKAVCSDEVGAPFKTKADFYATVNNKFSNIHVEFLNSVTKKIDYLVWAGADGSPARYTNKVKKTEGYNAKYKEAIENGTIKDGDHEIPIVTAQQFLNILEKL